MDTGSFTRFLHKRSLTLAVLALLGSISATGLIIHFSWQAGQSGRSSALPAIVLCAALFLLCGLVLLNLVRDVERGYSPNRCSIAAVLLLVAFAGPTLLTFLLFQHFAR